MKFLLILFLPVFLFACNGLSSKMDDPYRRMVHLRTDTLNVVEMTDSMLIFESTCRGCAFEKSTRFDMYDSMGIIKIADIITTDNNPDNMDGGHISKDIILAPVKPGVTRIKLYKIWGEQTAARDSAHYTSYNIEVKNK